MVGRKEKLSQIRKPCSGKCKHVKQKNAMPGKSLVPIDIAFTLSPYNSSKHFICKSSPLVDGNPGT